MMSDLIKNLRIFRDEMDPDVLSDFSFLLGDFNYRMDSTFLELHPQIGDILTLREGLDQMHRAMIEYGKFPGYIEPPIHFKPTYKRSKVDEAFFNKKNQAPSYTDRIIYKNNTTQRIKVNKYTSLEGVLGSDHRPVILDVEIESKQLRYMSRDLLLNPKQARNQGVGVLKFPSLRLKQFSMPALGAYLRK